MQVNFDNIKESSIEDKSGAGYLGILIGDYRVSYDKITRVPEKDEFINEIEIMSDENKKSY